MFRTHVASSVSRDKNAIHLRLFRHTLIYRIRYTLTPSAANLLVPIRDSLGKSTGVIGPCQGIWYQLGFIAAYPITSYNNTTPS